MARAELRAGRAIEEIGQVIVAAWDSALPENAGGPILPLDEAALSAAFSNILNAECIAVVDRPGSPPNVTPVVLPTIYISVPYPPASTKAELVTYLHNHFDQSFDPSNKKNPLNPKNPNIQRKRKFSEDMGQVVFFGCGK